MTKQTLTSPQISNWKLFMEVLFSLHIVNKKLPKIFAFILIYISFLVADPYFYKLFIDGIEAVMKWGATVGTAEHSLFILSIIWGGFVIVSLIVAFIFRYEIWKLANYEWHACSNRLAHTFLSLGYNYHISVNMGERTKNYDRWPASISQILQSVYATILPQTLLFVGLFILGFVVNWRMMLVIIGFFPLIGIVSIFVGKKVHVKQKEVNAFWDKTLGRFTDSLQNIAIIKLFAREKKEETIIQSMNFQAIDTQLKINVLWGVLEIGSGFIDFLARTVVMIVGVVFIMHQLMTLGELFLFVTLAGRIFAPLNAIEWAYWPVSI